MSETDALTQFASKLHEAGLLVECIEADGLLHRCGTIDKPNSKNGAYKAFLDAPASLWWQNWQTGDSGTFCVKSETQLTIDEREALKQRTAEARAERQRLDAERRAQAAQRAQHIWNRATPATDTHPYLMKKGVSALGLRLAHDGRLILPIMGATGKVTSVQFINDSGEKRFLSGGQIAGGYFALPAKNRRTDGALLIAEGYATAASLHMCTGYATLVGFNAGNLLAVAEMARSKYPTREIVVCGDNDAASDGNPGVRCATAAARSIGAKLAVCPLIDDKPADFNDLHQLRGELAVREIVAAAAHPKPDKAALRVVDIQELLTLEVPPHRHVLYPVIPEQGLCMLFAERGVGKTFCGLHAAYTVAVGGNLFAWKAEVPCPVLYIDGEMPLSAVQERLAAIVHGCPLEPPDASFLRVLTPDLQGDAHMPNLATPEGQRAVEPFLAGVKLVVVDNLATLARTGRANDEESWQPVQEWVLSLRRRGIAVLLVHHASKNGSQRGTSAKEDVLDVVIQLRRPADYKPEEGARFEVHLTKARGIFGPDAEPFEARLVSTAGQSCWETKTLEASLVEQVRLLADEGLTMREIAEELGATKSKIGRLCREHGITTKGGRR